MTIWNREFGLEELNKSIVDTMDGHLGMRFTENGPDYLKATLEVSPKTRQPFGLFHGGASCVLAESLGSVCSNAVIDDEHVAVGMDLQAHHIRPANRGLITGICRPVHLGKTTHLWEIKIVDENEKQICNVTFRTAVIKRQK